MQMCPSLHCHSCCYSYSNRSRRRPFVCFSVAAPPFVFANRILVVPGTRSVGVPGGFRGSQLALWRPSSGDSCFGAPELDPPKGTSMPCPGGSAVGEIEIVLPPTVLFVFWGVQELLPPQLRTKVILGWDSCSRHCAVRVLGCHPCTPQCGAHFGLILETSGMLGMDLGGVGLGLLGAVLLFGVHADKILFAAVVRFCRVLWKCAVPGQPQTARSFRVYGLGALARTVKNCWHTTCEKRRQPEGRRRETLQLFLSHCCGTSLIPHAAGSCAGFCADAPARGFLALGHVRTSRSSMEHAGNRCDGKDVVASWKKSINLCWGSPEPHRQTLTSINCTRQVWGCPSGRL